MAFLLGNTIDLTSTDAQNRTKFEYQRFLNNTSFISIPNSLHWWRANAVNYHRIAKLARSYICIPGTSVPSRVFSNTGNIVTKKRAGLDPDTVNQLIFLKGMFHLGYSEVGEHNDNTKTAPPMFKVKAESRDKDTSSSSTVPVPGPSITALQPLPTLHLLDTE